jgi:hypothetical protein
MAGMQIARERLSAAPRAITAAQNFNVDRP